MTIERYPTWETIVENCTNDACCAPGIRELVRSLELHLRQREERIDALEARVASLEDSRSTAAEAPYDLY